MENLSSKGKMALLFHLRSNEPISPIVHEIPRYEQLFFNSLRFFSPNVHNWDPFIDFQI